MSTIPSQEFEASRISDLRNNQVPVCLYWNCKQVCEFFEQLGLAEYKETLIANKIDGRRLIYLEASHLPKLGIHDFKHILKITKNIRELLKLNEVYWNRSISYLPRDIMELYLEGKSVSGKKSDSSNYQDFAKDTADSKWQPPLANQGLILPRN